MTHTTVPVTIGMPVFNGEAKLAAALESLLSQSYGCFRLIVSDNASTDATPEICKAFAARDPRITYVRQDHNIGADGNFDFVLAQAQSEYFMWAAADDTRSPDFIESNLQFLEQHADFVGSTCRVRFVGGEYDPVRMGDETRAEPTAGARIARFFDVWHANGRFYSLFRRASLVDAKRGIHRFLGSDWAVVIRLLAQGKLNRLDSGTVVLGRGGTSQREGFIGSFRKSPLRWLFPLSELAKVTRTVLEGQSASDKFEVARKLCYLNSVGIYLQLHDAIGRP